MTKEFVPTLELQIIQKNAPGFCVLRYPATERDALMAALEAKLAKRFDMIKIGPDMNGSSSFVSRDTYGMLNFIMPTPAMIERQRAEWNHFNPPAVDDAPPLSAATPAGDNAGTVSGPGGMASDPGPARPAAAPTPIRKAKPGVPS